MNRDPHLDRLKPLSDRSGHRVVKYIDHHDDRTEFPNRTSAAYITGPSLPDGGLPFCVPSDAKEIWAERIVAALACAYIEGAVNEMRLRARSRN